MVLYSVDWNWDIYNKIRVVATFVCLYLLPQCWSYSITSSLGPSFVFESFSSATGTSTRQPSGSLLSSSISTASPLIIPAAGFMTSASTQGYSHFIYSRQSDSGTNFMRPYLHRQLQDPNQHTPAQLQIASRIHFESHLVDMTTAKPYLGYRSFLSSYRNPNYFGKKNKSNDNRSTVKRYFPHVNETQTQVQISQNQNNSAVTLPSSTKYSAGSPVLLPNGNLQPAVVTTPDFRTAPATVVSSSATERPSSTQQMQHDDTFSLEGLDGSASANHYQYQSNGGQRLGFDANNRTIQISPPVHSLNANSSSNTSNRNNYTSSVKRTIIPTISSSNMSGTVQDVEETIVFPTTVNPTPRTYKIPLDETDLSGLKNILQESKTSEQPKKEFSNRRGSALPSKEVFGSALEGVMYLDCAKSLGYCEKDIIKDNYPKDLLNSVLTNSISSDLFKKVFGDVVDGSSVKSKDATDEVVLAGRNNINVLTQETQLCVSQEVTIYPRVARNKDDKWMFVVNHDDYVQGVKVEKCMNEGGACPFTEGNPLGYESVCRQKYILRKLVALNDDGKTALDTFKLPSCCVCYIKSNYVSDRIGAVSSASRNPTVSDTGSNNSASIRGSNSDPEEMNDSPDDCVEKGSTAHQSSNSSSPVPQQHVPVFNSSTEVNTTLS